MILRALLRAEPSSSEAHLLGRRLLKHALRSKYGICAGADAIACNHWGKPYLIHYPELQFSISHSGKSIACVISEKMPVGIDVEPVRRFNRYAARHVLNAGELLAVRAASDPDREFFRYWTLKESFVKAIGMGLAFPMKKIAVWVDAYGIVHSNMRHYGFILLEDEYGYITSVCRKKRVDG